MAHKTQHGRANLLHWCELECEWEVIGVVAVTAKKKLQELRRRQVENEGRTSRTAGCHPGGHN